MRFVLVSALALLPAVARAQSTRLSPSDSALVGRILLAEDRRDTADAALAQGARHPNSVIQLLARRARARIVDPRFAARDSFPAPRPAKIWAPEPAWRTRFRAVPSHSGDCAALDGDLADSAWAVRLRAVDTITVACAADERMVNTLRQWIDDLPGDASRRAPGGISWHGAAHGEIALAKLRPADARQRLPALAGQAQWQLRAYAARAAAVLHDTAMLRRLAVDPDDNVKEVAVSSLSKLTGHQDDALYLAALRANGAQAVRAGALALAGSRRADVRDSASAAFTRWVARQNASAHDVRAALLAAAGRPASDDRPPVRRASLPSRAVALALGEPLRLRVTMAPASGGGSFVVELRGDVAPLMAGRIWDLARSGYYNGLTWHRVEPEFVIQGGSPGATEYVGLSESLRDELGTLPHIRGTVGMSTRGHDTGDAQWFVNLRDNLRLGRDYTVFGDVIEGIDVVDGVLEGDVIASITPVGP